MKKIISIILTASFLMFMNFASLAQGPPPPPPDSPGGGGNSPIGGGAPIGSGTLILLTLGAAYGLKKYNSFLKKENLEE